VLDRAKRALQPDNIFGREYIAAGPAGAVVQRNDKTNGRTGGGDRTTRKTYLSLGGWLNLGFPFHLSTDVDIKGGI